MVKQALLTLLVTSVAAGPTFAQPALTPPSTAATTPTVVTQPLAVAPWIERGGNLRLSIACGELEASTPEDGLDVQIDGAPLDAQQIDGWGAGYLIAPGRHHVQVAAPGCAPSVFDFDADPIHSTHAVGRLVLDDWARGGTAGSPDGFGFTIGAWVGATPHGVGTTSVFNQTTTFDGDSTAGGALMSFSHERHYFMTAFDMTLGGGSTSGTVSNDARNAEHFTAGVFDNRYQFRLGARLPLRYASLAAGTGVGLDWWITSGKLEGASSVFAPDGPDASFYLPMWGSVTVKTTCNWGVQALGQYDVHPSSMGSNGFSFGAGILYQPSASCREAPGVRVSAN